MVSSGGILSSAHAPRSRSRRLHEPMGCSPHCAYVSAHHALVLATHRAANRGRIFSGPALAIASAAATSEARSYEVSGTARAWNILCGNGRGGQLDRVEKGTGVIGTHHLSLATRTARIRARLAIAGSRYGLQLEGERAMATGEPREKEYQDASVPRGTSARGRYLVVARDVLQHTYIMYGLPS